MNEIDEGRPRVGISACLLGQAVRYDGGHKRDPFCARLGPHVVWVPVCPEVESGLAVPREALRLVGLPGSERLVGQRTGQDHTDAMMAHARERIATLGAQPLDGYILKKDSPSCGLARVRIHRDPAGTPPERTGTGLFARVLREQLPALPVTEDGWLHDPGLRECFLHQVFTHHRLRTTLAGGSTEALVEAHATHKFLLLAHSPTQQRQLGRLVAHLREAPLPEVVGRYIRGAMAALAEPASRGKHANVLQHIVGYLRGGLAPGDRDELLQLVEEFRRGLLALGVPLAVLAHHVRRADPGGWLARQVYFQPFPRALSPFAVA